METPDSLAVDSSYWQQLADIIATADCLQYVHRVRLVKISERMTGLIADIHLNQAVVSAGLSLSCTTLPTIRRTHRVFPFASKEPFGHPSGTKMISLGFLR